MESHLIFNLSGPRQCTVEIENATKSYHLTIPRMHVVSGACSKPLPFEIQPGKTCEALFAKTPGSARGAVGVFTYDLFNTDSSCNEKIAIMFSVPFDYRLYSNWYAVGVFNSSKKCDRKLYDELYNNNHSGLTRGAAKDDPIRHTHGELVIDAAMSNTHTPHLLVKLQQN